MGDYDYINEHMGGHDSDGLPNFMSQPGFANEEDAINSLTNKINNDAQKYEKNKNQKWSRADRLTMYRLLAAGLSASEVASKLGRTKYAIDCQIRDVTHKGKDLPTENTPFNNVREQLICATLAGFIDC